MSVTQPFHVCRCNVRIPHQAQPRRCRSEPSTSRLEAGARYRFIRATPLAVALLYDGRNSDCTWPDEPDAKTLHANQPDYAQHLSGDAEFAEELAIRYMDAHHGPRSGRLFESHQAAGQAKNRCLGALFGEIGKSHHI